MKQTMRILNSAVPLILAGLLSWQTCFAQVDPWERVKLVEPGKKLSVKLHSGRSVNGKMETWSTDGVAVRQGKDRVVQVKKSDVAQVAMVMGMSRARKAALAGGITGAIGGGLGGLVCAGLGCDGEEAAAVVLANAGLWGGIAAGIASLFAPHKEVLYTALPSVPATGAPRD
jgi:hypothetical protein